MEDFQALLDILWEDRHECVDVLGPWIAGETATLAKNVVDVLLDSTERLRHADS